MSVGGRAILEVRTYRLRPGERDRFDELLREFAVPMMAEYGITVVDHGISLVEEEDEPGEGYFLIRTFSSLAQRAEQEGSFYGSDQWRQGPRAEILSLMLGHHHTIVAEISPDVVKAMMG